MEKSAFEKRNEYLAQVVCDTHDRMQKEAALAETDVSLKAQLEKIAGPTSGTKPLTQTPIKKPVVKPTDTIAGGRLGKIIESPLNGPTHTARGEYLFRGIKDMKPTTDMAKQNPELWKAQRKLMTRVAAKESPQELPKVESIMKNVLNAPTREAQIKAISGSDPNTDVNAVKAYDMFRRRMGPDASLDAMGKDKARIQQLIDMGLITAQNQAPAAQPTA